MVVAILGIAMSYMAMEWSAWRAAHRVEAAIRHLGGDLDRACALAVATGRAHAVVLSGGGAELAWELAVDGDGDGVRRGDIAASRDPILGARTLLARAFPGVAGGRPAGVPTINGGAPGTGGVAFGSSSIVSCSPSGAARSGTLYLYATRSAAALRVYGPTGRQTQWWWDAETAAWGRLR